MPKGNRTGKGGRKFLPGQSGNPGGLTKEQRAAKDFQRLSYADFIERLKKYGCYTESEVKSIVDNPETQMFDLIYCRHLHDAMMGKEAARESLYNRLWGKVKDQVEVSQTSLNKEQEELLKMIPIQELVTLVRNSQAEFKKEGA